MKRIKYLWRMCFLMLIVSISIGLGGKNHNVQAAENTTLTSPGASCKDGNYIYYAYERSGIRMGIMRLNPKNGSKKQIFSYKYKGKPTNGFEDLTVKGSYIYATWDMGYGSSPYQPYIYKIRKDGKGSKRLTIGSCPVIAGGYIYYIEHQKSKYEYWGKTGYICRMNLDGSGKKRLKYVGRNLARLFTVGNEIRYSTSYTVNENFLGDLNANSDTGKVTVNGCEYYFVKSGYKKTAIYRKNLKTGKKNRVAYFPAGIQNYRVTGNYLMIKTFIKNGKYFSIYCVSADGKKKHKLASWRPAE